jgi:hypothetical protein
MLGILGVGLILKHIFLKKQLYTYKKKKQSSHLFPKSLNRAFACSCCLNKHSPLPCELTQKFPLGLVRFVLMFLRFTGFFEKV